MSSKNIGRRVASTRALMVAAAMLAGMMLWGRQAGAEPLAIRVSQAGFVVTYEVRQPGNGDLGGQGFFDLVVPSIAFINSGGEEVSLEHAWLELSAAGTPLERVYINKQQVQATLAAYAAYASLKFPAALNIEFGKATILPPGIAVSKSSSSIPPRGAILVADSYLLSRGAPDLLTIKMEGHTRSGQPVAAESSLPVVHRMTKNSYLFPLERGSWFITAFPGLDSHHRFTQSTEFALDITRVDGAGEPFRDEGYKWTDWYAYGCKVLAAADGAVVKVVGNADLDPAVWMPRKGESPDAYNGRIQKKQLKAFLAPGADPWEVAAGNYIVIQHANGEYSSYSHLAHGSIRVKVGQHVVQGQFIARVGGTGERPEAHLHFQVTDSMDFSRWTFHTLPVRFLNAGLPAHLERTGAAFEPGYFVRIK